MISLTAKIRDKKEKNETLRKAGILPGILYGEGMKNIFVSVDEKDFSKALKEAGETSIMNLEIDSKKTEVLIHEITKDPVSGRVIHIDFFHPSSKRKMETEIPLVFQGESEAVTTLGGILSREINELHVRGLAKDFPKEIIVDISVLSNLEDRLTIKDLALPSTLEIIGKHPEDIVVHIVLPKKEKIEMPQPVTETATEEKAEEEKEEKGEK